MRTRILLTVALSLLVACGSFPVPSPTPTETPSPSPTSTPPTLSATPTTTPEPSPTDPPTVTPPSPASPTPNPTPRPIVEEPSDPPPRPLPTSGLVVPPPRRVPTARRTFWVAEGTTGGLRELQARLRTQSDHAAIWVEEGLWHDVRALEQAADRFETEVYTPTRAVFGFEWTPGIDADPRIQILHVASLGDGVQAYASTRDEYPATIHPLSNQAELIVVGVDLVEVGSPTYQALLARELTRLIIWHQDRNEAAWIREGLVELGASLAGANTKSLERAYLQQPDLPLTHWKNTDAQRGAAYLLATYLQERLGNQAAGTLVAERANGIAGFAAALQALDAGLTFDAFFTDWLAATYLASIGELDAEAGGYADLDLDPLTASAVYTTYPVTGTATVNQLGADAIIFRGGEDLEATFEGTQETVLLTDTVALDGLAWWSNRTDESLAVLTRTLDLKDVDGAAITYRAWYDIEHQYDYAALEVSADGGVSWQVLETPSGTSSDPYANNPGWGYTGNSGGWIKEEVDLSDFAGATVQVRFSYLTDGAYTGDGFVLDEIVVRRTGIEDLDDLSDWHPRGFVLTDGTVQQAYTGVLITLGDTIETERLSFQADNTARWSIPLGRDDVDEAVLILSAQAPLTRQPAAYRLQVSVPRPDPQSGDDEGTE